MTEVEKLAKLVRELIAAFFVGLAIATLIVVALILWGMLA